MVFLLKEELYSASNEAGLVREVGRYHQNIQSKSYRHQTCNKSTERPGCVVGLNLHALNSVEDILSGKNKWTGWRREKVKHNTWGQRMKRKLNEMEAVKMREQRGKVKENKRRNGKKTEKRKRRGRPRKNREKIVAHSLRVVLTFGNQFYCISDLKKTDSLGSG